MTLIEQTKAWREEHKQAGRELEVLACDLRLKPLERCEAKKLKPHIIEGIAFLAEGNIDKFNHESRRSESHKHYQDEVLINHVVLKAVKDFKENRK